MKYKIFLLFIIFLINVNAQEKLKVGVLAYGTVNWELDTLKYYKLDKKNGFDLEVVKLASKNATSIALQAKEVDIIVTDWLWVNTQRANGKNFTLYPYSRSNGTILVPKNSKAKTFLDLYGKKLGVAGGPVDKTWLILRAYSKQKYGKDLADLVKPTFSSPPIIYKNFLDSRVDSAINFWHFNAKLKAKGAKELVSIKDVLSELGVKKDIVFIGWTIDRKKAMQKPELFNSFIKASHEAKDVLLNSDNAWDRLRTGMKAKDDKVYESLKAGYRAGVIKKFDKENIKELKKVYNILLKEGGKKLVGASTTLDKKTFWEYK
ncbi:MAG: ABC transporter substrate-binding protein [Arcobacter sp.]|uniref:ABC transporter substrate-binding protein n=1 Tax=Arcobacter sp. TaxID=1872629 RepID=UPI003B00F45E